MGNSLIETKWHVGIYRQTKRKKNEKILTNGRLYFDYSKASKVMNENTAVLRVFCNVL